MSSHEQAQPHAQAAACYLHPDRPAGVTCQRCDRLICTSCMNHASVGVHCPKCVSGNKQKVYTRTNMPGTQGHATHAIIALNLLAFLAQVIFFDARAFSDGDTARELGTAAFYIAEQGEWWRIISGGFLHFGVLHLGMNMYSLYHLGPMLERQLGTVRFALAYMAALVGGSLGALVLEPRSLVMGASGAIFGLLGLLVTLFRSRGISINQSGLGPVLMLNVFISLSPFVSLGGHAGGFLTGAALGVMYFGAGAGQAPIFGRDRRKPDLATAAILLALFVGCLVAAATRL